MDTRHEGFSLIELLFVVAIIGVISVIAVPAYQDYTARSQATEGITLAYSVRTNISDLWASQGILPENNTDANLPQPGSIGGRYVESVGIGVGGLITVTMKSSGNYLAGKTFVLAPSVVGGALNWVCKTGTASNRVNIKYLPSFCREG